MSYATIDDNISDHPKVIAVGNDAELVFLRSIIYANRVRTDGIVPTAVVPWLCRGTDRAAVEKRLIDGRLWEHSGGGDIAIHDFLDHNLPKATILERMAHAKEAGRLGGQAPRRGHKR